VKTAFLMLGILPCGALIPFRYPAEWSRYGEWKGHGWTFYDFII